MPREKKKKKGTLKLWHPPAITSMLKDGIVSSVSWPGGIPPQTRDNLAFMLAQILSPVRSELELHQRALDTLNRAVGADALRAGEQAIKKDEEQEEKEEEAVVPAVPAVHEEAEEPAAPRLDRTSVASLPADVRSAAATDTMSARSWEGGWASDVGAKQQGIDIVALDKIVFAAVSRVERSATLMMEKVGNALEGAREPGHASSRAQRAVSREPGHASSSMDPDQLRKQVQRAQSVARSKSPKPPHNIRVILDSTKQCVNMAWPEVEAHLQSKRVVQDGNGNLVYLDNAPFG